MSMLDPTLRSTRGLIRRAALTTSAALAFMGGAAWAQTEITFWHSMDSATETVDALVEAFHASQDEVRVDARMIGAYSEANTRLLAAFGGPDEPVLFQAEIGFLPRLVAEGATQPLTDLVDALPETMVDDFVPGLWTYGEFAGERHGLPWNSSTPVMYWNVDALRRAGIEPPTTWAEFEAAADALTSRQAQGVVFVGDSWLFEMMVLSRGGRLTDERGVPTLDSPEALAALTLLDELEQRGSLAFFGANETTPAILGFVRTRSLVAFASIANWPDIRRFSVAFDMTAGPVPMEPGGAVPLGGAQLVVMKNATPAEREAAFQFWEFLMEPENLATWVEGSYYIPVRQSVVPLLDAFYAEVPGRGAALGQLDAAIPRPRIPEFEAMRGILDDMMEKVLRGRMTPEDALAEAQAQALAEVAR